VTLEDDDRRYVAAKLVNIAQRSIDLTMRHSAKAARRPASGRPRRGQFWISSRHAYRTAPLKGVWTHSKGGFYHAGRFATLADVVTHCDTCFSLGLTAQEQSDVVEYMKSLPQRR